MTAFLTLKVLLLGEPRSLSQTLGGNSYNRRMPTYEYACQSCGTHVEVYQRFNEASLTECGVCEGPLRKVFHPAGILFKGSGFYVTDSRASASKGKDSEGKGADRAGEKKEAPAKVGAGKDGATKGDSGGSTSGGGSSGAGSKGESTSSPAAKERSA